MDRREFFRRTGGGMLLGAPLASLPATAAALVSPAGAAAAVVVIGQADRSGAVTLAQRLAAALGHGGRPLPVHARDAAALRRPEQVDALLALPRGTRLLGVMDDASAIVFLAMASSRGAHLLAHGHHRLASQGATRHACSATGCGEALAWHEPASHPATHVERFYLATLGETTPGARTSLPAVPGGDEALASFLIRL